MEVADLPLGFSVTSECQRPRILATSTGKLQGSDRNEQAVTDRYS